MSKGFKSRDNGVDDRGKHDFTQRLLRGTGVLFVGNIVSAGLGFLGFVLLARAMSAAEFGQLAPMLSILEVTQIFMETVIGGGLIVYVGRYIKTRPERAEMAFKMSFWLRCIAATLIAGLGWWLAPWVSQAMFQNAGRVFELRLCFIAAFAIAIYTASLSLLQANKRFVSLTLTNMTKNFSRAAGVIVLLVLGAISVESAIYVFTASAVVCAVVGLMVVSHAYLLRPGLDREVLHGLFATNRAMLVLMVLFVLGARMDMFMLAGLSTDVEVGQYAAAFQLASALALLGQALITSLLPEIVAYQRASQLRNFLYWFVKWIPLALVSMLVFIWVGPMLVESLLGQKYADAGAVFNVLIIATILTTVTNPLLMIVFPLGKVSILVWGIIIQLGLRLILNWFFMENYGAVGAVWVDLFAKIVSLVFMFVFAWRALARFKDNDLLPSGGDPTANRESAGNAPTK